MEAGLSGVAGRTLYLDWETDFHDLIMRAKYLQRGHPNLAHTRVRYRRNTLPLAEDLSAIQKAVAEHDIRFVVVDSLAAACGGDLSNPETAIRFFTALRSLRVGSLILPGRPTHLFLSQPHKERQHP